MSSSSKSRIITFKCPKCGRIEKHAINEEDLKEIRVLGIARLGFIHGDHSVIINFDPTGFIRGAYVVPSEDIPSDVRTYFKDYRIVTHPQIKSGVELIIIDEKNKVIDVRLADVSGKDIVAMMNYLEAYGKAIKGIARRIGISGRSYGILSKNCLLYTSPSPRDRG